MIRRFATTLFGVLAVGAMAQAQSAPAITIDPSPSVNVTTPSTPSETTGKVVLSLPIAAPPNGSSANVSQSIQQDTVADLTTLTTAHVIAPVGVQPATNEQMALDEARQHNADFVVWGQSQVSGNQMRVTGQLLRVSDGRVLAGLKATAPMDDLFPLEDSLAAQVARALPAPIGLVQPPQQPEPTQQGNTTQPPPTTTTPPQTFTNPYYSYTETVPQTYYSYNTYYYPGYWSPYWGYPYWGYYPYYWGGIGIYGGWWGHGWYGGHYWGHPGGFYGRGYGGGFHAGGFAARGGGFAGGHAGGGGGHR